MRVDEYTTMPHAQGFDRLSLSNSTRGNIYMQHLFNFEASQFHQYMYHHVYKDSLVSLKKNKNLYFFPHTLFYGFQFYMFDVLAASGYE